MKQVLVTGSLGYIGSALTEYLKANNYNVIGWDCGYFKDALLYSENLTNTIFKDVRSISENDFKDVDAVVHLAGISNDPVGKLDPALVYDPTREYTLAIAKICKKKGIKFIFASSCSIYGIGGDDYLSESSPTHPQTFYSKNKQQIEDDLCLISDSNFSPIALRFATIFGPSPRIRFDVVINMLVGMASTYDRIILNSNGLSWRPNLHIQDACQAIKCALELNYTQGKLLTINVGDEINNLQVIEIAKIVQSLLPKCELVYLSDRPDLDKNGLISDRKIKNGADTRTYKVSFDKIKNVLPLYKNQWTVEEGVKDMINLFREIPLTPPLFNSRGFYRLQRLEDLFTQGYIAEDLTWLPPP